MRAALRTVGAPEGLVQNVAEPTIEGTKALMQLVDVVVATGAGPADLGAAIADALHVTSTARYNDGSPATVITLEPMDGIILQRGRTAPPRRRRP
jgi:hypothetical protein